MITLTRVIPLSGQAHREALEAMLTELADQMQEANMIEVRKERVENGWRVTVSVDEEEDGQV